MCNVKYKWCTYHVPAYLLTSKSSKTLTSGHLLPPSSLPFVLWSNPTNSRNAIKDFLVDHIDNNIDMCVYVVCVNVYWCNFLSIFHANPLLTSLLCVSFGSVAMPLKNFPKLHFDWPTGVGGTVQKLLVRWKSGSLHWEEAFWTTTRIESWKYLYSLFNV